MASDYRTGACLEIMARDSLELRSLREDEVDAEEDGRLRALLALCFTELSGLFLERRYYLEPPEWRWILSDGPGDLVAHAALRERRVRAGTESFVVGGVSEVCVHPDHRGRGYVRRMLDPIHDELRTRGVDFVLLFGDERIYGSSGYRPIDNVFRYWDPGSLAWVDRTVPSAQVLELFASKWPEGGVDIRGILY